MHKHIHIYIYIYVYTYVYIYIYTYTYIRRLPGAQALRVGPAGHAALGDRATLNYLTHMLITSYLILE